MKSQPGTRSFWAGTVDQFMSSDPNSITGKLATRLALIHSGNHEQQILSWNREIDILRNTFHILGLSALEWGLFLEMPLQRIGKRLDAVITVNGCVIVIEFKIGALDYVNSDIQQVEDYALCLRDFHSASRNRLIIPLLCSENAQPSDNPTDTAILEFVSQTLFCNAAELPKRILFVVLQLTGESSPINWREYDYSTYNPTPSIVEAARHVYAGNAVAEIGRADSTAEMLSRAALRLKEIATVAKRDGTRTICFVSGTPGSGKTMLGLDLVFTGDAGRVAGEPAALLSGNRPLVHVLREALVEDAGSRGMLRKEARRRVHQGLQNLLDYLREHSLQQESAPPENVLVFDEAQRAWDSETGKKLLGRHRSEPALFLDILNRMSWACLVCLVGPGQEINRGEGGLPLWGQALEEAIRGGNNWVVHAQTSAIHGGIDVGMGLLSGMRHPESVDFVLEPHLHLSGSLRSFRTPNHGLWVSALLKGDLSEAKRIAGSMETPPAYITHDIYTLKTWLKKRCRGGHRVGLLNSSGAVRLTADGLPASPRSNELDQVAHWFLRPSGDFRSSNSLETPLTEFVCQGLEIDYAGLCWGGDLVWTDSGWQVRRMRAPKWQIVRKEESIKYGLNTYRVLLTRARVGMAIFIPKGNTNDPTRNPKEFAAIYKLLIQAGCELMR